jgi:uncharacterized protein (DUF433 family)
MKGMKFDPELEPHVWSDSERLGGALCFRRTRVPIEALLTNLEDGVGLDEFLKAFPGVRRESAVAVLEYAWRNSFAPAA